MGKIREELMKAAEVAPKRGEDDSAFLIRLQKAISEEISEEVWDALSDEAQDWNNDAADAITAGKPIPPFKDEEAAAPVPAGRRRGTAAPEAPPAPVAYEPKVGDEVTATTKRGKVETGFIVEFDDATLVLNPAKDGAEADDIELPMAGLVIAPKAAPEPAPAGRTRGAARDAEPQGPSEPEVGDTVEVETKRGKVLIGNVTVLEGDDLVIKDAAGTEHELSVATLKTFKVKVKNGPGKGPETAAEAPAAGRRRGGASTTAPVPPAADAKTKRSANGGVSVGTRVNELVIDNPGWSMEQVGAVLKKEGLEYRENTLSLTFSSANKFLDLLRARKLFK